MASWENKKQIYSKQCTIIYWINWKWKQCIGYFLSSAPVSEDKLHILVKDAIDKLSTIWLSVRGIMCDQGSHKRNFVETHEGVCAQWL